MKVVMVMFIKKRQYGFTLMEVIMSMAVFSIGALMVLTLISLSIKYMQISTTRYKATNSAKAVIDSILSISKQEEEIQAMNGAIFFDEKNNLKILTKVDLFKNQAIKVKRGKGKIYSAQIKSNNYIKVYEIKAIVYSKEGDKLVEICRFKTTNPKKEYIKVQ